LEEAELSPSDVVEGTPLHHRLQASIVINAGALCSMATHGRSMVTYLIHIV